MDFKYGIRVLFFAALTIYGCASNNSKPAENGHLKFRDFKHSKNGSLPKVSTFFEISDLGSQVYYGGKFMKDLHIVCSEYIWIPSDSFQNYYVLDIIISGLRRNKDIETTGDLKNSYNQQFFQRRFFDFFPYNREKKSYSWHKKIIPETFLQHVDYIEDKTTLVPVFYGYKPNPDEVVLSVNFVFISEGKITFHQGYVLSFFEEDIAKSMSEKVIDYLIEKLLNTYRNEV